MMIYKCATWMAWVFGMACCLLMHFVRGMRGSGAEGRGGEKKVWDDG